MVSRANSSLQFPSELEVFISNDLEGIYHPNPKKAYENKDADIEHQKINLSTYFPRSFLEAYMIFEDLINNESIQNMFNKNEFFLLDIGGGLGGNLCGLLWFMKDYVKDFKNKKIHIVSIDCNNIALDMQEKIIHKFFMDNIDFYPKNPELSCDNFNEMLHSISKDYNFISYEYGKKFDIIMTFKFVNELYRDSQDYFENEGMYKKITESIEEFLDANGLFILADTADKNDIGKYFPKMISEEISEYLKNDTGKLRPIAPLSCAFWYMNCRKPLGCYNLKLFEIKTLNKNYTSKLSYKILAHTATAERILERMERQDSYRIGYEDTCDKGSFAYQNPSALKYKDAFSYYHNVKKDNLE